MILCSEAVEEGIDFQGLTRASHVLFLCPIGGFDRSVQIAARVIRKNSHKTAAPFDQNVYIRFFCANDSNKEPAYLVKTENKTYVERKNTFSKTNGDVPVDSQEKLKTSLKSIFRRAIDDLAKSLDLKDDYYPAPKEYVYTEKDDNTVRHIHSVGYTIEY